MTLLIVENRHTPKNPMSWESSGKILEQRGIQQSDILEKFPEIEHPLGG